MSSKTSVAKLGAICLDSKHSPKLTQDSRKLLNIPFRKYGPCLQPGGKINSGRIYFFYFLPKSVKNLLCSQNVLATLEALYFTSLGH